jgi:hypothetical protein
MWIYARTVAPDWSPDHSPFAYGGTTNLTTFALDMDVLPQMELYVTPFANSLIFSTTVSASQWFHVAATYDGSQTHAIVNGLERGAKVPSGSLSTTASILQIGGAIGRSWFIGMIDEVRLWRVARTEMEIRQAMSVRLKGNEPNLVGYWRFDEGSGTTVVDSSVNHSNGVLEATPPGQLPLWVQSGVQLTCPP